MKRYAWLFGAAILTVALGCGLVELKELAQFGAQQMIRFILNKQGVVMGTGFVMEGRLVTAKHVADPAGLVGVELGEDIVDVGPAPMQGYTKCRKQHKPGDKVTVSLGPWPGITKGVQGMLNGPTDPDDPAGIWGMFMEAAVLWPGVSGSPVICDEHNGVIGVITRSTNEPNWMILNVFTPVVK